MAYRSRSLAFCTLLGFGSCGFAGPTTELSIEAGTAGIGPDLSWHLSERIRLRAGYRYFTLNYDQEGEQDDESAGELIYSGDLTLNNGLLLLDYFPGAARQWYLSAGALFNGSRIDTRTRCDNPAGCEAGGQVFVPSVLGTVHADYEFEPVAPYLGLGWRPSSLQDYGFSFQLGVAYTDSPSVDVYSRGGNCAATPGCEASLEEEERELEQDAQSWRFVPVVSIGWLHRL